MERKQKDKLHHRICKAITNSGDRCKRPALTGSDYCSSHRHIHIWRLLKRYIFWGTVTAVLLTLIAIGANWAITKYTKPEYVTDSERGSYGPKNASASESIGKEAQRKAKEAFAALESGDSEKAERLYLALSELFPNEPMFHYNLGVVYLETDESEVAVERFQKAVDLDSSDSQSLNNLGVSYLRVDEPLEAIKAYRTAIEIKPNEAHPYANLGWAYFEIDSLDASAMAYRKAIDIQPGLMQAYVGLGTTLIKMNLPKLAIDTLRLVLQRTASAELRTEAHFYLGNAYDRLGRRDLALAEWSDCLAIDSFHFSAGMNYSWALIQVEKYDTAIEYLTRLKEEYPDSAKVYVHVGVAHENKGNRDSAASLFRKAISLDPNLPEPYNNLGMTLANNDSCRQAIQYFNKAIDLKPDCINALFNLGTANVQCGNLQRALAVWGAMFRLEMSDSLRNDLQQQIHTVLAIQK